MKNFKFSSSGQKDKFDLKEPNLINKKLNKDKKQKLKKIEEEELDAEIEEIKKEL
jgi:hypothetical protein